MVHRVPHREVRAERPRRLNRLFIIIDAGVTMYQKELVRLSIQKLGDRVYFYGWVAFI